MFLLCGPAVEGTDVKRLLALSVLLVLAGINDLRKVIW